KIFVDSTVLRHELDGSATRLCPTCRRLVTGGVCCAGAEPVNAPAVVEKGTTCCEQCGSLYRDDLEVPYYARYEPLVIAARCPEHGLFFAPHAPDDLGSIRCADAERAGLGFRAEDLRVEPGPKSADLIRRNIRSYLDLFSSRQLLYLRHAIDLLGSFEP